MNPLLDEKLSQESPGCLSEIQITRRVARSVEEKLLHAGARHENLGARKKFWHQATGVICNCLGQENEIDVFRREEMRL